MAEQYMTEPHNEPEVKALSVDVLAANGAVGEHPAVTLSASQNTMSRVSEAELLDYYFHSLAYSDFK